MKAFLSETSGAVTIDLVVMSAGLVGLGMAVMVATSSGMETLSRGVDTSLRSVVLRPDFNDSPCPRDWASMHGRNTGLGAPAMLEWYDELDVDLDNADISAALAAYTRHPYDFRYRESRAMAEVQIHYCLAEERAIPLP